MIRNLMFPKKGATRITTKMTLADDDINDNWEMYKDRFLKGGFP